ncbi:glyoxalase superfamily protein [Roseibium sp. MMSF_3544]|uniref:glyoxalase superfamily protein n=1 Tax=unclassified Roseibium TaxID=2629323 RepID=UPI00273F37D5|nr:glyoxalase superfamily protein [Roseibium sp. MMSF_3544]
MTLPSVDELKSQAKRLKKALNAKGQTLSHGQALELVSAQHGFRDWNTASATALRPNRLPFAVGDRVSGSYMQQAFEGEIVALTKLGAKDRYQVTVQFDQAVDVVTFDSFSAYRSRVTCVIRADGIAVKQTSNGEPYLKMQPAVL